MASKTYNVKTLFVFKGNFKVKAESREQAKEFVEKHCGMTMDRGIHSTLPDDDIDWDFPVHPEKKVR